MNENHAEFDRLKKAFEESRDSMHAAIEAANIYYFEYFPDQDYALEHNGREEFGIEERMENYPESWFEKKITHPEDEILLRKAFLEIKSGRKKAVCDVRNLIDGVYHWHHYNFTSIYDGRGERIKVVCMAQDITGEKKAEILKDEFQRLYERTPAWIFSCKNDAGWTIQRTNPRIYEMTGYTAEEFALEMENEVSRIIPDKYRVMIQSHIARMEKEGYGSKVTYDAPVFHKNGSLTWLNVDLYWDKDGTEGSFYVSCSDITKLKANEEELRENNTMYRLTTQQAHISLWKYDIVDEIIYNTDSALETHPGEKNIKNFPSSVITAGMIRQDSIPEFLEVFQKLKEGEQSVTADVWIKRRDGSGWWCERINYAAVLDENNRPYMAFGLGRDVTELKEIESRIKEEEKFQEGIENEKLLLKIRGNITLNEVDTYEFGPAMNLGHIEKKYDQVLKQIAQNGYGEEDKDTVLRMLSTARIESAIKDRGYYTFEYRRRDAKGNASWVSATIRAFYNPEDHNIMAFVYLYDINREKNKESVINRVVEIDYEVLALIYPKSNEMECIRTTRNDGYMSIDYSKPYNEGIREFIECYFEEEKREEALQVFEINNITSKLDRDGVYEISYGMQGEETYHKKWVFAYLDETKSVIIYTRSDITDLLRHQEEQQNALKDALVQAEEASNAKSNFLSRMSHEIRTPMNAIIGMNALAAQVVDNPEQVKDCLSKVGLSARFLLSLINDILDMSRIESGKTVLKNRKFPLEELVNNVNSIFYEQAVQKGIDYDCIITSFTSTYYIGDSMKLQQVIVNLLGNAIKFTNTGGKVQLVIHQDRVENGTAYMTFSVNDTGVGIDPKFQETMFEPFEQGDTTITTPYKGTGLGLAITKNLVNMMGGTINVNSIEGVGSEFVTRIPLKICAEEAGYQKLKQEISMEKMSTLIVDDDITICMHTKELLLDMGMKAEWVESGQRAVDVISKKWQEKEYYDIVLLDWRMPDMDGIETARRIRRIVGNEVTIIVMTAYEWIEIEQEAKQAGVNMLMTKPLFKSTLVSAFERAFQVKEETTSKSYVKEYDFTGKHILLVEDHILNVEVAKRLLEAKHAEVHVAENGLRAIEMFMESEEGYYDVILMDIRMPVMDGLTSTKSIRQLRRPSAKTIPIIAMSANAFDEDVEKSKAAGMNEHISKPIEPQVLYASLARWLG